MVEAFHNNKTSEMIYSFLSLSLSLSLSLAERNGLRWITESEQLVTNDVHDGCMYLHYVPVLCTCIMYLYYVGNYIMLKM